MAIVQGHGTFIVCLYPVGIDGILWVDIGMYRLRMFEPGRFYNTHVVVAVTTLARLEHARQVAVKAQS